MTSIITEREYLESQRIQFNDSHEDDFEKFSDIAENNSFFPNANQISIWSKDSDWRTFSFAHVYYFNEKSYYVVVESVVESCAGCYHNTSFEQVIKHMYDKAYITTSLTEANNYSRRSSH